MNLARLVSLLGFAAVAAALGANAPAAQTRPANTLRELYAALERCWRPPSGTVGYEATLRFSLRRDGSLIDQPSIVYTRLGDDDGRNGAFLASVLSGVRTCAPVPVTSGLGGAIAGRMMAVRFRHGAEGPTATVRLAPLEPAVPLYTGRNPPNRSLGIAQRNLLGGRLARQLR